LLISVWFFTKKNTLRFVRHFSWKDLKNMLAKGFVRATTFATTACMMWLMNRFVLDQYDITTFQLWVVAQKIIGFSAIFEGFTLTLRPIISTLKYENNTKAMRMITHRMMRDLICISVLCTVMIFCFTSQFLQLFGIRGGDTFK
jgi:hypothetical protein